MKVDKNIKHTGMVVLMLGALGVVFGDIGTSPLYVFNALFSKSGLNLAVTQANVYGIVSLIIWSVVVIVAIKYVSVIMRVNNGGEGGIMALVALIKESKISKQYKWLFVVLGILGVSLFYGDSMITPAISVLSAVEGLNLITPTFGRYIIPITVIIIVGLFALQRYGTAIIGKFFGPIMLLWFSAMAIAGGWQVWQYPDVLLALSPLTALQFVFNHPFITFIAMAAVVLAITGAEALYADMGHFGRQPIARSWFVVVFPALLLCYMGQGAILLRSAGEIDGTFFRLFPSVLFLPIVVLATAATLIASQSVISGAFSLTRQAVQMGFLPNLLVRHTSEKESGQVYIPLVNTLLFVAVLGLVIGFGSSGELAHAFGVAISGTLLIDSVLFIAVAHNTDRVPRWLGISALVLFVPLELLFVMANSTKIISGGWFPLTVAAVVVSIILTWIRGQEVVSKERKNIEGTLSDFVKFLRASSKDVKRIEGQAIYIAHHAGYAPLALKASVERLKELHEYIIIVVVKVANSAHVDLSDRAKIDKLKYADDGIVYIELTFGYHDTSNVPRALMALESSDPELVIDFDTMQYFVSLSKITPTRRKILPGWQRTLYLFLDRNRRITSDHLHLPVDRTIDIEVPLEL